MDEWSGDMVQQVSAGCPSRWPEVSCQHPYLVVHNCLQLYNSSFKMICCTFLTPEHTCVFTYTYIHHPQNKSLKRANQKTNGSVGPTLYSHHLICSWLPCVCGCFWTWLPVVSNGQVPHCVSRCALPSVSLAPPTPANPHHPYSSGKHLLV